MFDKLPSCEQKPEVSTGSQTTPHGDRKDENAPRKPVRLPAYVMHG